ncbi:unnamed protein product (macronuclear) [Paramecium tetraurelia]|uniref:Uncharacterized protein n=1 Tax=Paramecium tetraurelia TaxID=5888 RepID=A0BJ88_PARTE|nr:uncharacterized protein GSPATT00004978001 [Paramecium tetraurelia]CAK58605.1 unnamed protein product [Paramecium tetraurelia]|eukprot:XP_001426003.1 hypothetical protein (macronuclear) [Paramecium tetraurelia strain d4-2]
MQYNDPQFTLLNIEEEWNNVNNRLQNPLNLEPWNGNYDHIFKQDRKQICPKKMQIKIPLRIATQSRRRSMETNYPSHQDSCPKIEIKQYLQSFQKSSLSPRKNSTQKYRNSCIKTLFQKSLLNNSISWTEYYKVIQKNRNEDILNNNNNVIGQNSKPLQFDQKQLALNNFRMKLKQKTKNKTVY